MTPRYRHLAKAALWTTSLLLLAFGIAHVLLITWVVDRSEDASFALRLAIMFGAPILVGLVPAAASALLGAWTWQRAWSTPLASWRWGPVFAMSLAPPLALNALFPDELPSWALPAAGAAIVVLVGAAGAAVARSWPGALAGIAALPTGVMVARFLAAVDIHSFVIPFVACIVAIHLGSGWLMARFLTRST